MRCLYDPSTQSFYFTETGFPVATGPASESNNTTGPPGGAGKGPRGTGSTGTPVGAGQGPPGGPGHPGASPSGGPGRYGGSGAPGAGPPSRNGGPGGYGTWRLRPIPGGPDLTVHLEPVAVTDCGHQHYTTAHDPSDRLRHLVEIRDGECTHPPCRRAARHCDFEHTIPWETGGPTCACNTGARCRHHHHMKQAPRWRVNQHLPGYHTWTTPSGRHYTNEPTTYPH